MNKYIHYCWFGDKPLPKLAKKCIESWKKYLPDYEIIKWSEENVDLNECPFIKEAYANKKWAFVADYARTKALKEMGGIYFDTDMEVIKNVDNLFDCDTFLGIEDTGFVAVGVWYEKEKDAILPTELLKKYRSMKGFSQEEMASLSIPKLISQVLDKYGLEYGSSEIQVLNNTIKIYPREYFYPYSYDRSNNLFTDNTCMIHYYDASWIPFRDRFEINMARRIGRSRTYKIMTTYHKVKDVIRKIAKVILFPLLIIRNIKNKRALITEQYIKDVDNAIFQIKKHKEKDYIVLHNGGWFGVTSATKELFENTIDCRELYRKKEVKRVGEAILDSNIKQVIFSSMSIGDKDLAIYLKRHNKNIKIKTYWHGSHSQVLDKYGWARNVEIIKLHKKGIVDVMSSCKESLLNFYKNEGYKALFITNKVTTDVKKVKQNSKDIIVGLYAAKCNDWRKNMYSQMAAVSLIKDAVVDMTPLNDEAMDFAKKIELKIQGEKTNIPREELLKRLSQNTVNMYVTYSECAPMLPLESFEMGVPCIIGNNCHYFEGSELEEYLVVNNEEDPEEIAEKIRSCIKNKDKILKLYNSFKKENLKEAKESVEKLLKM